MLMNQDIIRKVKEYFNLNIYETKVWLALLSRGIASAGEIAELSGVPRSRTYDVLEGLEKQGFAIPKIGKPVKYIAVKPTSVLELLKRKTIDGAELKVNVLENLKKTEEYKELESLHNSSIEKIKREELSGAITGKSNVFSKIKEMLVNAEKEVLIYMPALEMESKKRVFNGMFEKLKEKNIAIKIALNGTDEQIKRIANRYNIKPKKTNLNTKFLIIDRKQVLFGLTPENEDETAVWLNSEFFSEALSNLFEQTHKK